MLAMILTRPYLHHSSPRVSAAQGREAFLEHLRDQGTSRAALRGICWQMLNVMEHLRLKRMRSVSSMRSKKRRNAGPRSSGLIPARGLTGDLRAQLHLCGQEVATVRRQAGTTQSASDAVCGSGGRFRSMATRRGRAIRRCRFSPTAGRRDGS